MQLSGLSFSPGNVLGLPEKLPLAKVNLRT